MFGVSTFVSILPPNTGAILAVAASTPTAVLQARLATLPFLISTADLPQPPARARGMFSAYHGRPPPAPLKTFTLLPTPHPLYVVFLFTEEGHDRPPRDRHNVLTPQPFFLPSLSQKNGMMGMAKVMTVTLTCDHRNIYGADAAKFLKDLAAIMETETQSLLL